MPFEDGSGILVLAHTNNAVDEIEKKLKHCRNFLNIQTLWEQFRAL